MSNFKQGVLPKGFLIDEKYTITLFIKTSKNADTYRLKGKDGKLYFLKLFNYSQLHRTALDSENNLLEINYLKNISHPNIASYKDSGELIYEGKKYAFLILNFIAGETLAETISREPYKSMYDIKHVMRGILNALSYLHSLPEPIIHNEITPQNVMIDLSGNVPEAKVIDFGFARSFHQLYKSYNKEGLNLNYVASESFNGFYSPQSDIFSAGALMYQLIFGMPPWFKDISKFGSNKAKAEEVIIEERKRPFSFNQDKVELFDFDESVIEVLKRALHHDTDIRFHTAEQFLQALDGKLEVVAVSDEVEAVSSEKATQPKKKKGQGFDAIAGMQELKAQLKLDVIDALHKPEEYAKYGITIPNGMLLYGPPGCGKTFFAKHFAEEVGFNFMFVTPSTLKSRFVNATQENIAKMFEEAEKNAPTIIFIDEINELLPSRDSDAHEMAKSAVNEMLAQMDRTGEKGIFIIGATNYPTTIDPAILRAGRLDKKFYLPPPDFEARKAMFEMYLKPRPLDFGIDYNKLSRLTENYVSSDIEFLVNEASRLALKERSRITMLILEEAISISKPSVPISELMKYETLKSIMNQEQDNQPQARKRIGFKP